jgi:hypothetical protein
VLSRATALLAGTLLVVCARPAGAQDDEPEAGLRLPAPMTVGLGDQFLGRLSPDGSTLIFVTNRDTVTEIFAQRMDGARARLLFDEGADVTWPRISPDGRSLLYVSHRDRAAGQLCVRDLPDGGHRRCLDDGGSALQAEWIDARRIALVSRASIEGDLRVLEVDGGDPLTARPLLARNLTSPAVSPDGRWLVYVPIERTARLVGPAFAARAAQRLEAVRLDEPAAAPIPLPMDLPGVTGQPAFGRDGRHLYFVQFFSDSNRDGVIDARDHGVLFRVPFPADAPARIAEAPPEQLTDASWNCQYPAPARDRLVATCSRDRDLDVYELPLDGEVPESWDAARLAEEIELTTERVQELILHRHRLTRERDVTRRRLLTVQLVRLHLDLGEFHAAEFYARSLRGHRDPVTRGLGQALRLLVEHRRAAYDRDRGRMVEAFGSGARRRLEELRPDATDSPPAVILDHVVRSEIADDLGDKGLARRELEAAAIGDDTPRSVLEVYYERADALYRELDDPAALAAACRRLAAIPGLEPEERLLYARAAVRAMTRGLPFAEADAALAGARSSAPADSELAFALELGRAVLTLRSEPVPREARHALVALFKVQTLPHRRRAMILDAVGRAAQLGADLVIEQLSRAWLESAVPGTTERRSAERLFRRAFTGRGYRHLAAGQLARAREDFDAVVQHTASIEGVVSSLDVRIAAGERPEAILEERARTSPGDETSLGRFVKAYLLARQLPALEGEAHSRAVAEARAALRASRAELGNRRVVRELQGALQHEEYLATGELTPAERANAHYLVALEQSRNNVRLRALVLGQLGVLHGRVGNHRIALRYLQARERLPIPADPAGLAIRLAEARALLHVDREADAAAVAERALAMVEGTPALAPYRVLALDRAALSNLAAARFERALALYDAELPLLGAPATPGAARNLVVVRLARAAAALGAKQPQRVLEDLAEVDRGLAEPATAAALQWPQTRPEETVRAYRLIAAGLRANASRALGRLDDTQRALEERRAVFLARLAARDRDEDLQALTLVEARLADVAAERRDLDGAGAWLGHGLGRADALARRTHAAVDPGQLDVLLFSAQLRTLAHSRIPFDLAARLAEANERLARLRDPAFRTYQRWFEIYETLATAPREGAPANALPPATATK